tara:strand:+ start:925 stop:1605 length:681 start_codon:yes stop_codon:yes gene_type:complete
MGITELAVLKWLHILSMVYWLGGEWGVFQTSYNVINRALSMEERHRHLETLYRIDILARTGIILLLPLGMHMGYIWGVQPYGGNFLIVMWALVALWLGLCWMSFFYRETDHGITLTKCDELIRFVVIPVLFLCGLFSLMGKGPFAAGEMQKWFSIKIMGYSFMLVIGLKLRFIMREWTDMFRVLASGPDMDVENSLEKSLRAGRRWAYVYWIGIGTVAFFGVTKFI